MPLGIEDEFESLWGILGTAAGFGFEGEERVEFVRRCLHSLLAAGAVPVEHVRGDWPNYRPTARWGREPGEPGEIVEAVIADWLARGGGDDLEWGAYPFTFPENFEEPDPEAWRAIRARRLAPLIARDE